MSKLKITVKSFNGIGDLLFVTPTLKRIKERYPEAEITVNTNYPELLINNPFIDKIGRKQEGTFLGYPDPIHGKNPTHHHIISDWEIIKEKYNLDLEEPELCPLLYFTFPHSKPHKVGVQVIHKGHWSGKKVWPKFNELLNKAGPEFEPIPRLPSVIELVQRIKNYRLVICAEGGISHIAKALGTPAIVIYGGFANPEWNGYEDQINVVNVKSCSYCYNPFPCVNQEQEKQCLMEITVDHILKLSKEFIE